MTEFPSKTQSVSPPPRWERPGRVVLTLVGSRQEQIFEQFPLTGGRHPQNELCLAADGNVSQRHFELRFDDDQLILRDLGSKNGTFVAGVRVREAPLDVGDEFTVGESTFRVLSVRNVSVQISAEPRFGVMYGESPRMREFFAQAHECAATPLSIVLQGETGTGKELAARAIHAASDRSTRPFVAVNCGAIPREIAESEFFGHVRGAFTGAVASTRGLFEAAHGGTLFLDELGELSPEVQVKLLRALEGRVQRVGETHERSVDVRIIAATHRDLRALVVAGSFRQDLYYRIAGRVLRIPPLRERGPDILGLARHSWAKLTTNTLQLNQAAEAKLLGHSWPGNVRELDSVIRRLFYSKRDGVVEACDLHLADLPVPEDARVMTWFGMAIDDARQAFEHEYLRRLRDRCVGANGSPNKTEMARLARVSRNGLLKMLERHRL